MNECSDCRNGVHMTCFGTCQCEECERLWRAKNKRGLVVDKSEIPNFLGALDSLLERKKNEV